MYEIKAEQGFIVVSGSDIIDGTEAQGISAKVNSLLALEDQAKRILVDVRKVNLEESNFDIFVQYLSKMTVERISLVLPELINKFKFRLWRRRYKNYVSLEQFVTIQEGIEWLKKE